MKKIAIITENDNIWALFAWERAVPLLKKSGYTIEGLWNCEKKFTNKKGKQVYLWYLDTFGLKNFVILSIFHTLSIIYRKILNIISHKSNNFKDLSEKNNIPHYITQSPNDDEFVDWVKKKEIDIVIIMVGHIIKEPLLNAPKLGIINKHAAILPSNKGMFPYFWAKLHNEMQGVSFHKVVKDIDAGDIVFQKIFEKDKQNTMIEFYFWVFYYFPEMLIQAIDNMIKEHSIKPLLEVNSSYYSLPTKKDYYLFKKTGADIISLKDLVLPLKMLRK